MPGKTRILITGVTGYIGGSVLNQLLKHPHFETFDVTAVVRSQEKADKLKALGVKVAIGSHTDPDFMTSWAESADVVIAVANADCKEAALATLAGLKKRYESTGRQSILIHTSGTAVLTDKAVGDHKTDIVYDDMNVEQLDKLPPSQPHREIDLELLKADAEGYVRTYFILPGTVWGQATGVLVDQGIQNPTSQQVPLLIKASLARGRAGMIGNGINVWPNVNIDDVADLYMQVLNASLKNPEKAGHGREGFYFGENGEHTLYQVSKAIGEALVAIGKAKVAEPDSFTREEIDKFFNGNTDVLGTNCRCKANRSRSIGWNPTKTKVNFLSSIKPEVEVLVGQKAKN